MNKKVAPDFNDSLVNIPHTVLEHFKIAHDKAANDRLLKSIAGSSQIILLLADGLGYNMLKERRNFLSLASKQYGTRLTTVFPSSTPPAVTSLVTGLTPREHGLLEWNLFIDELGIILETFPYTRADAPKNDNEVSIKNPSLLYNGPTIFEMLTENDIASYYFVATPNHLSPYTQATARGATIKPFSSFEDLISQLAETINANSLRDQAAYYYVHWGAIDKAAHIYGPNSKEVTSEIDFLSDKLKHSFFSKLNTNAQANSSLILTADHGHVSVKPERAVYLNEYPQITQHFKRTNTGEVILPSGGARTVFLSVEEGKAKTVSQFINNNLQEVAEAIILDDTSIKKMFGTGSAHSKFQSRVGDVVILPKKGKTVWYKYTPDALLDERGDHGGLSPDEMYIPCVVFRYPDVER